MRRTTTYMLGLTIFLFAMMITSCGKSGEPKPNPEPEYVPPVSHIYKDDAASKDILELQPDGTVVYKADTPAEQLPKEGEIICSGVTGIAPEGFLYRVERVERRNGVIEVKTSPAYLDEVIKDAQGVVDIDLANAEVESVTDAQGRALPFSSTRSVDGKFKVGVSDDWTVPYTDGAVKLSGSISTEIGVKAIFDFKKFTCNEFGLGLFAEASADLKLKATAGVNFNPKKKPFPLYTIELKPITILIAGVPVVFTPRIPIEAIVSGNLSFEIEKKIIDLKVYGDVNVVWKKEMNPETGSHWYFPCKFENDFDGVDFTDILKSLGNAINPLKLKGGLSAELSVVPVIRTEMSLYNLNDNMHISPYLLLEGKVKAGLKYDTADPQVIAEDYVTGSLSFGVGVKANFVVKVFKKEIGGEVDAKVGVFDFNLWTPFALTPQFSEIRVTPSYVDRAIKESENILKFSSIKIRSDMVYPMTPFSVTDFGFCYTDRDYSERTHLETDMVFISLKDQYGLDFSTGFPKSVEATIFTKDLRPNTKYYVYPYAVIRGFTVHKKGLTFKTKEGIESKDPNNDGSTPDIDGIVLFNM